MIVARAPKALFFVLYSLSWWFWDGWNPNHRSAGLAGILLLGGASANPQSNPYVAFRTSPTDGQENVVDHAVALPDDNTRSLDRLRVLRADDKGDNNTNARCRTSFALGISKRVHGDWSNPIVAPPVVYPALPGAGPGKQVLLTQYEHLDLLSPSAPLSSSPGAASAATTTKAARRRAGESPDRPNEFTAGGGGGGVKEVLLQSAEFPLLLEGSTFWTSPIVVDANGDGRPQALVTDSAGGIYVVGLTTTTTTTATTTNQRRKRSFQAAQVPRLFVRREWIEGRLKVERGVGGDAPVASGNNASDATNVTQPGAAAVVEDPYHTYFEYYYSGQDHDKSLGKLLQGVSANAFSQESEDRQRLLDRRRKQRLDYEAKKNPRHHQVEAEADAHHRPLPQQAHDQPGDPGDGGSAGDKGPKRVYDDDFVGDDLEYMLAKQRLTEEREGQIDDDPAERADADADAAAAKGGGAGHGADLKQPPIDHAPKEEQAQRRRLAEEGGVEGDPSDKLPDSPEVDANREGRDRSGELVEGEERGLFYDDVRGDTGRGRMDDAVDVDKQESTDDLIGGTDAAAHDDPKYGMHYDDYYRYRHGNGRGGGDDTYSAHNERHREYYDTKHYIRIPPHVLCTPVLAELPKLYTNTDEKEDVLFVAVSYFLDEDEYDGLAGYKRFAETDHGDETEASRGMYVASAIMAYVLGDSSRWTGQTHLDLSTDYSAPENLTVVGSVPIRADLSKMGAFALGSPTVADIDGDGNVEVLIGTSMGFVYAFDARQMYKKSKFPIQMPHPVESRVLVEDVRGDTNLELFVADTGGDVVCFSHEAVPLWNRNLATSLGFTASDVQGSSPMSLGDVNGDGNLDVAIAVLVRDRSFLFVLNAATGVDLPLFPVEFDPSHVPKSRIENVHHKLSQPLLVDLHPDQSFIQDYIRRNGTAWTPKNGRSTAPGLASGLHIVYPQDQYLHIIEGGSGCSQVIAIGDPIGAMVQVDDVHGTNRLDLIVSTEAGDVITLESPSPYHPLNTWSQGEQRGRMNGHAHGYSASQGIFVHEQSRQYIDVFGVYVPITFEIFDNRPNIQNEESKRQYSVEIRDGPSSKRALFRAKYDTPGVYTERFYIRFGPGFYTLHVVMLTSHGLLYEDTYHIGYNVRFMDGFGILLWLPLLVASLTIVLFGSKKSNWDDPEIDNDREGHSLGILGRSLPS